MRGGYRLSPQPILSGLTTPGHEGGGDFNAGGAIRAARRVPGPVLVSSVIWLSAILR